MTTRSSHTSTLSTVASARGGLGQVLWCFRTFLALRDRGALIGTALTLTLVVSAIGAPMIAPFDPNASQITERGQPPSIHHLLGTDELGRDLFSRILYGARISMTVSVLSVGVAATVGVPLGVIAAYYRGGMDLLLMRVTDVIFAIPSMLLALALVAILGAAERNVILAIAIVYVPGLARVTRAATLAIREHEFVTAARAMGARTYHIIARHLLPNIASSVIVQLTTQMGYAMLTEASLSFFGLGVQPPTPSWGNMLSEGKPYMETMPWMTIVPGVAIMLGVLGLNLVGDAIRDLLDPRVRDHLVASVSGSRGEDTG